MIEGTIKKMSQDTFTVLDFIEAFRALFPDEWNKLLQRYGLFGGGRRYTATTYLSNRLDIYSQKPGSQLAKFTRYSEGRFKDYRRTTEEERRTFGSPWIAVYRKKRSVIESV